MTTKLDKVALHGDVVPETAPALELDASASRCGLVKLGAEGETVRAYHLEHLVGERVHAGRVLAEPMTGSRREESGDHGDVVPVKTPLRLSAVPSPRMFPRSTSLVARGSLTHSIPHPGGILRRTCPHAGK